MSKGKKKKELRKTKDAISLMIKMGMMHVVFEPGQKTKYDLTEKGKRIMAKIRGKDISTEEFRRLVLTYRKEDYENLETEGKEE